MAKKKAKAKDNTDRAKFEQQSINLATLRDTLLPKLMSGEIRVVEAEKMVKDVT